MIKVRNSLIIDMPRKKYIVTDGGEGLNRVPLMANTWF
jgi:hypothetical protein